MRHPSLRTGLADFPHPALQLVGSFVSRDPLGDEAFLSQYGRAMTANDRHQLRRQALKPLYGFLDNQAVNAIDNLGLRSVCVVTVRASHFLSGPRGAHEHFNATDWSAVPAGDSFGYVSCGANTLNDGVTARNSCAGITGMPRNHNEEQPTGRLKELMDQYGIPYDDLLWEDQAPSHLDAALEAAKQLARVRCRSRECGCCMNVRIVITCDPDTANADKPESQGGWRTGGITKCGMSTTLDCKTGNFSMLR